MIIQVMEDLFSKHPVLFGTLLLFIFLIIGFVSCISIGRNL